MNDPGNMAASNATPAAQTLFDTTTLTQNNFTPALNTGNGNTFWITTVNLTAATSFNVTISDVVFDYVAVNASAALNVDRTSDFTVTLLNPSAVSLGQIDIIDALSGNAATPQTPSLSINGSFSPVPEPSALALLGLGAIGLCFRRRRA